MYTLLCFLCGVYLTTNSLQCTNSSEFVPHSRQRGIFVAIMTKGRPGMWYSTTIGNTGLNYRDIVEIVHCSVNLVIIFDKNLPICRSILNFFKLFPNKMHFFFAFQFDNALDLMSSSRDPIVHFSAVLP